MKPGEYIKGDRRGRGAHDIELEAMRDPFLADALEGLESAGGDHAETVAALDRRIAARAADAAAGATDDGSARDMAGQRALGRRTDEAGTSELSGKTGAAAEKTATGRNGLAEAQGADDAKHTARSEGMAAEKTAPGRSGLADGKKPVKKERSASGTEFGEKRYPGRNGKPDGKSTNGRRYLWRTVAAAAAILIALTAGVLTLRHTPAPGAPGEVPPLADNRPNHPAKADSSDGTRPGQPEAGQTSAGGIKSGTKAEPGNGTVSGNGTHPLAGVDATHATPGAGKQGELHSGKQEERKPGKQPADKGQPEGKLPDKDAAGTRPSATQPPTEVRDNERQPGEQPRTGQQPAKKPELQGPTASTDIDEVVVVAYGMSKKAAFTGSTGSGGSGAAANVLHGNASASAPAIRIRGTGGTKRDTAPYRYTVDGNACTGIAVVVDYGMSKKTAFTGSTGSGAAANVLHSKVSESAPAIRIRGTGGTKRDTAPYRYTVDGKACADIAWVKADSVASISIDHRQKSIAIRTKGADALAHAATPTGNDIPATKLSGDDLSFVAAGTMPRFRGGSLDDFRRWVQARIRKPRIALHNGIGGRVIVAFTIDTLGRLTDIEVLQTPDKSLSDEAVRVLKQSPDWEPGRQRDKKVRVRYTIPVYFGEEETPREKPARKEAEEKHVRNTAEEKPQPEKPSPKPAEEKPWPGNTAQKPAEQNSRPENHDRQPAEEKSNPEKPARKPAEEKSCTGKPVRINGVEVSFEEFDEMADPQLIVM